MHQGISASRRAYNIILRVLMYLAAGLTCLLVLFLIGYVLYKGVPNLSWELVSTSPSYLSGTIGILPDLLNTLYVVMATLLIVLPLGVCAAIYLTEYAANKRLVAFRHSVDHLRTGRYAVLLPVPRHEDLPVGRQHDACHHESADHHAHHAGEP